MDPWCLRALRQLTKVGCGLSASCLVALRSSLSGTDENYLLKTLKYNLRGSVRPRRAPHPLAPLRRVNKYKVKPYGRGRPISLISSMGDRRRRTPPRNTTRRALPPPPRLTRVVRATTQRDQRNLLPAPAGPDLRLSQRRWPEQGRQRGGRSRRRRAAFRRAPRVRDGR
jgi:hypothetical protein